MAKQLDTLYRQVAKRLTHNKSISIQKEDDYERIHLTRSKKVPEGQRLKQLKEAVSELMPELDLPDLLLEVHQLTGFADEFDHISENRLVLPTCPYRSVPFYWLRLVMSVLMMLSILVFRPCAAAACSGFSRTTFVKTLTQAIASLVAAQAKIPLAQQWGGGHVASADGQRFKVPVESLTAAPNYKSFGEGRGITYFTFMSDQFSSFYGTVIPGAVREALYILDGLLDQQTVLKPVEVMTDTAGYTDIVFGLFWLLGYQFSPRLKSIGKTRFWRFDKKARYGIRPVTGC